MTTSQRLLEANGLPQAPDSERIILGALFDSDATAISIRLLVRKHHFALDSHQRIFAAAMALLDRGVGIEFGTLFQELTERKELKAVGDRPYIYALTEGLPRNPRIGRHAETLLEYSRKRDLLRMAERASLMALDNGETAEATAREMAVALAEMASDDATALRTANEVADAVADALRADSEPPFTTAVPALDGITSGGIRRGELWIAGGLPGRGKSSFARHFGYVNARKGTPVMVHTIEMPAHQWLMLDTAGHAGIEAWKLRTPALIRDTVRERFGVALEETRRLPFFFEENAKLDNIIAKSRVAAIREGAVLHIIDYAQRVQTGDAEARHRLARTAEELANFAKAENVAVLLLSQLTPAQGATLNTRPTMQWLRESRDMEAHAHAVLLNYLPVELETGRMTGEDEIIVGKQRFGPVGSVPVRYNRDFLRFEERKA